MAGLAMMAKQCAGQEAAEGERARVAPLPRLDFPMTEIPIHRCIPTAQRRRIVEHKEINKV